MEQTFSKVSPSPMARVASISSSSSPDYTAFSVLYKAACKDKNPLFTLLRGGALFA
jgi:hypothetical protein